jgi:hypothetical protein
MKKIIFLFAALILSVAVQAQSTTPRFGTTKNSDNTGRVLTYKVATTNDAAGNDTISITPNAWETILRPSSDLTDSVNIRAYLTNAKLGDYLTVIINKGSGAGGVRFISTYFVNDVSTNRYTVAASKTNIFRFQCNGVKWIMIGKTIQP